MNNIAIIPARSGSKGLIDKNIRPMAGLPLMAYTINAAKDSGMFSTIMVSTDSDKYAEIAISFGAEVPFLRGEQASSDTASSWDVVAEVLEGYKKLGKEYDSFMLLQPTSPLRSSENIRDAYRVLEERKAESIVSVCEADHSPLLYNTIPKDMSLEHFVRDSVGDRRQDLETFYRFNGAIYLSKVAFFETDRNIYRKGCFAYLMDKKLSVDIDDEFDFILAETIMTKG